MFRGITINFAGGSLQYTCIDSSGKLQHIDRPMHTGFHRLHRIPLIMDRTCRTRQIVYFITFNVKRESHIVADEFKPGIVQKFINIAFGTGKEVVNTDNFIALREQCFAQVGTEKSAAAGN
jgi:hypothetical protein